MNSTPSEKKVKLPRTSIVFFCIAAVCLVIYIFAIFITPFADFFNRYVSSFFRSLLAYITNILPFSLAEIIIISLPVILVFLVVFAVKRYTDSWRSVGIYILIILSVLSLFFSSFILTFGTGYYTSEFQEKLGLERKKVSAEELAETASILVELVNAEIDNVKFKEKSSSIMPYDLREMNKKLLDAYRSVSEKYTFIPVLTSHVKPIMLSEPMTYTHITGVYTFFTGEANLNTNSTDYTLPFTAAHELAHQRGIAREDEANFTAFLVCAASDDAYIRYCGYLNLCEYVLNALYGADQKLWEEVYLKLDPRAIYEMIAFSEFFDKYRESVAADISGAINDAYLQANNTEGTASYGLVVDLAVAYFKSHK